MSKYCNFTRWFIHYFNTFPCRALVLFKRKCEFKSIHILCWDMTDDMSAGPLTIRLVQASRPILAGSSFLLLATTRPDGMNESRRWKSLGRLPSSIKQGDWHICRRVIRPVQLYSRLIFVVNEDILRQFTKRSSSMLMTKSSLLW